MSKMDIESIHLLVKNLKKDQLKLTLSQLTGDKNPIVSKITQKILGRGLLSFSKGFGDRLLV